MKDVTPRMRNIIREHGAVEPSTVELYANPLSLVPTPIERDLAIAVLLLAKYIADSGLGVEEQT